MRRLAALLLLCPSLALADDFTHDPPGKLHAGSGEGRPDSTLYAPDIRFPIESAPAFANSQVWGHGGGQGEGSQCDDENFAYPWHDNYCESRSYDMPLCPAGTGHQGQDVRAASCDKGKYWVVAVADGTITQIGSYTVYLTAEDGTRFDYLHMQDIQVEEGDVVTRGQRVGKVGNQFGGTPTTVHLHFNVRQNVAGVGQVFVPPYASLVDAYDRLLNPRPDAGPPDAGKAVDASVPPTPVQDAGEPETDAGQSGGRYQAKLDADSGCNAAGAPGSSWLVLAVGLALRRRRR